MICLLVVSYLKGRSLKILCDIKDVLLVCFTFYCSINSAVNQREVLVSYRRR